MTATKKRSADAGASADRNSTTSNGHPTEAAPAAQAPLACDLAAAWAFLRHLDPEAETFTFQTFDDTSAQRGRLAKVLHLPPEDLDPLADLNAAGAGIFVTVNTTDGKGRREKNVTAVRAVFVDLDGAPLAPVLAAGLEPHVVNESSPGKYHAYWLVDDCARADFPRVQRALARRFAGDPRVCDLPRVLRVPGFYHRKGAPFMVRALEGVGCTVPPYQLAEIVGTLKLGSGDAAESTAEIPQLEKREGAETTHFVEGGRNDSLFKLGAKLRRDGLHQRAIAAALIAMNVDHCKPPLPVGEVRGIAASLTRYEAGALPAGEITARAPSTETWPEPLLPSSVRVPEIPADLLPGIWGEMAAAVAASTQTPPAASVMLTLAFLAACLQRRYEVSPWGDDYRETLSLWVLVALPSGARKTAIIGALRAPIDRWEKLLGDRLRGEIRGRRIMIDNAEALIQRLKVAYTKAKSEEQRQSIEKEQRDVEDAKPAELRAPRLTTGDVTPETLQQLLADYSERMTVATDEAGLFSVLAGLYSGGAAHLDVFLQSWSGASVKVDRANRRAHLDRPALSMAIALQPDVLQEVATVRRFRDSGLLARFMYVLPKSTVGSRDVYARQPIPSQLADDYEHAMHELLEGCQRSAYSSHGVIGIIGPVDDRHNRASCGSA